MDDSRSAIRIVTDEADIAACLRLRRAVFIEEQGVSEAEEIDGLDPACTHVLMTADGIPIAAARVRLLSNIAKIQRVCVLPSYRKQGYGARIVRFILDQIATDPAIETARLGAQTHAIDFYRRLGFVPVGDEYLDAGIPHRDMELALASRQP